MVMMEAHLMMNPILTAFKLNIFHRKLEYSEETKV